ncbi:MAG: Sua5/YciO/YrdC/YwlC family protein [Deltaproteobacteria bacterium]|nr:Sua5/YciO/YrdC/YwlC family protein [Deltaproteobacteria bacterium]
MNTDKFLQAWRTGQLCLHPTDTIPGVSFHPEIPDALQALYRFKQRPENKPVISLIADLSQASCWWSPLTARESLFLSKIWPSAVSVIRKASEKAPPLLLSERGELALRFPDWPETLYWMRDILQQINSPFPTSSVNISGEAPAITWEDAKKAVRNSNVFIPELISCDAPSGNKQPSTVIRLYQDSSSPEILRAGAVDQNTILRLWEESSFDTNQSKKRI